MPLAEGDGITADELQLAARNHGMPLEALRHEVTPLGLHYLLVHYDIPIVDPATWRLHVRGRVREEKTLCLDMLRELPSVTRTVTMECAGNGRAKLAPRPLSQPWLLEAVGNATWTGVRVRDVLEPSDGAVDVVFAGLDRGVEGGVPQRYERALPVADAMSADVMLAYEVNGVALPPQHGFPVRLLVPRWYGMTSVKWLTEITVLDEPYRGYQNDVAYRVRADEDDPGEPVTRIEPRSLMAPPGVPDFMTRRRFVEAGSVVLEGRAWSGFGAIERVEVSVDGGASWKPAGLDEPGDPAGWRRWTFTWDAAPGEYELCCRCFDTSGRSQPDEPPWNLGGYANNAVHRVPVTVT
jgi:DMSO/TMAO reductase YedYZ molybdopterin-dependent catalytic subunit